MDSEFIKYLEFVYFLALDVKKFYMKMFLKTLLKLLLLKLGIFIITYYFFFGENVDFSISANVWEEESRKKTRFTEISKIFYLFYIFSVISLLLIVKIFYKVIQ